MKIIKKILLTGLVVSLLIISYGLIKTNINKSNLNIFDTDLEYYGVIDSVKIDTMSRGTPRFLINGKWVHLGSYGRSIRSIVSPGDSISKVKGNEYLELYRNSQKAYILLRRIDAW